MKLLKCPVRVTKLLISGVETLVQGEEQAEESLHQGA